MSDINVIVGSSGGRVQQAIFSNKRAAFVLSIAPDAAFAVGHDLQIAALHAHLDQVEAVLSDLKRDVDAVREVRS